MSSSSIYGRKEPDASGYYSPIPTPDVWTWKGFKKFGWWQHPKPLISLLLAIFFGGFILGGLIVMIAALQIGTAAS